MAWMIEVDGFAMDRRRAPREIQVIAFEQGLITLHLGRPERWLGGEERRAEGRFVLQPDFPVL